MAYVEGYRSISMIVQCAVQSEMEGESEHKVITEVGRLLREWRCHVNKRTHRNRLQWEQLRNVLWISQGGKLYNIREVKEYARIQHFPGRLLRQCLVKLEDAGTVRAFTLHWMGARRGHRAHGINHTVGALLSFQDLLRHIQELRMKGVQRSTIDRLSFNRKRAMK